MRYDEAPEWARQQLVPELCPACGNVPQVAWDRIFFAEAIRELHPWLRGQWEPRGVYVEKDREYFCLRSDHDADELRKELREWSSYRRQQWKDAEAWSGASWMDARAKRLLSYFPTWRAFVDDCLRSFGIKGKSHKDRMAAALARGLYQSDQPIEDSVLDEFINAIEEGETHD